MTALSQHESATLLLKNKACTIAIFSVVQYSWVQGWGIKTIRMFHQGQVIHKCTIVLQRLPLRIPPISSSAQCALMREGFLQLIKRKEKRRAPGLVGNYGTGESVGGPDVWGMFWLDPSTGEGVKNSRLTVCRSLQAWRASSTVCVLAERHRRNHKRDAATVCSSRSDWMCLCAF